MSNTISIVIPPALVKKARRLKINTSLVSREAIAVAVAAKELEKKQERIVRDATAKQPSTDMTNPLPISGEGHV